MHVLVVPSEHFLTPRTPLGGLFQMHQAQALREGGIKVGVISAGVISPRFVLRGYPYTKQECVRGIQVLRSYERKYMLQRNAHPSRVVETQVRLGLDLYRRYERRFGRPDVVHAHDVLRSASIARALQDSEGIPYGVTEHSSVFAMGGLSGEAVGVARECLRGAAFITAVSQALGRWVQRALDHRGLRVGVLPNVLDPDFQCHQPLLRARADSATFLSVGSLDCNKDHGTLLIAFAAQFGGGSSRLRIAGTGPLRSQLGRMCRRLGIRQQVEFLGHLDRQSMRREMSSADCLVLTSRVETFGVVLIEALASGTPVVATRCGGPEDIVTSEDGLLVAPGDAGAVGAAMAEVALHPERYSPERLQERCLARYGPRAFLDSASRLYESAIGGGRH